MAASTKYRFRYDSVHGVEYIIQLAEEGYSGAVIDRPLGVAPVLHMQESGAFRATSLDLTLECQVDGEFASLYTSDPKQFKIYVFRGGSNTAIWQGFVATEIYSEPDIAPPYDVKITATDGLGTLKEYTFEGAGELSIKEHLRTLLAKTGLSSTIYCGFSIRRESGTTADFLNTTYINLDYLAGKSYYNVLEVLLKTLHATVTQYKGNWLVLRESDSSVYISSGGNIGGYSIGVRADQDVSGSKSYLTGGRKVIGSMADGSVDTWPVGHLTRRVVPAKRSISVSSEWYQAGWPDDVHTWLYGTDATYDSTAKAWRVGRSGTQGYIEMRTAYRTFQRDVRLVIKANSFFVAGGNQNPPYLRIQVAYNNRDGGASDLYYDPETGAWTTGGWGSGKVFNLTRTNLLDKLEDAETITFDIAAAMLGSSGTLDVYIYAVNASIYSAEMTMVMNKGYKDTIVLDNGARGEGESVEITGSPATADTFNSLTYMQGMFKNSGLTPYYSFSDDRFTAKDYLALSAMDYALSVALPRIELSGTVDVPTGFPTIPLVLVLRGTSYLVKTYDWDLYNEDYKFTAVSVPAASLTVLSETVTSTGDAD